MPSLIDHPNLNENITFIHCKDFDMTYRVKGLCKNEFPVIGFYVDPNIIPGLFYKVRSLSSGKFLFEERAIQLESIGQGYEKLITFKLDYGNSLFFSSDAEEDGFAFTLEMPMIHYGERFEMHDEVHNLIGFCEIIESKIPEQSQSIYPIDKIKKGILISLKCKIEWRNGLKNIREITGKIPMIKFDYNYRTRIFDCKLEDNNVKRFTLLHVGKKFLREDATVLLKKNDTISTEDRDRINEIMPNEFPVVGTFIDSRILPGFNYIIRPIQLSNPLFFGEPKRLLNISQGDGYAKLFTFEASNKFEEEISFLSDSYEGFGFSPKEISDQMKFHIFVGRNNVGFGQILKCIKPQVEIESIKLPGCGIQKKIKIEVICHLQVGKCIFRWSVVCGVAVLTRRSPSERAFVNRIENLGIDSQCFTLLRKTGDIIFIPFQDTI